eukprot:gene31048-36535_t
MERRSASAWAQARAMRPETRAAQLAAAPVHYGAAARRAWASALRPKWAPSTWRTYVSALRLFRAVALGWDDQSIAVDGASNMTDGTYIAHIVEYCAYKAAGSVDVVWPAQKTPAVLGLALSGDPVLRPTNQLHWEMVSWGIVTMAVLGLRHAECEGLAVSDIRAPVGAPWELRILSQEGRTKTGLPGVPQWVPLPTLLFGMPYIDMLHRGGGALAADRVDSERWRRPVSTARFLFWLVARSLLRWHGERKWVVRLKRHNALGSFLEEFGEELKGIRIFPAWERSVSRATVASLAGPCGWATKEVHTERPFGCMQHSFCSKLQRKQRQRQEHQQG